MRYVIAILLCTMLTLVHTKLWWEEDSSYAHLRLQAQKLQALKTHNETARLQNLALRAELKDLRESTEIIEEHARSELGMIKPNEVLVLLR